MWERGGGLRVNCISSLLLTAVQNSNLINKLKLASTFDGFFPSFHTRALSECRMGDLGHGGNFLGNIDEILIFSSYTLIFSNYVFDST